MQVWRLRVKKQLNQIGGSFPTKKSPHHECPHQQCDQLVPGEEPIVTASVDNETAASKKRILANERNVPHRLKKFAMNCCLRDVEKTHRNERCVIARAIPFEAALV